MEQSGYGIHWFRRDLRVAGNQALFKNWQTHQGRVVGVFTFDKAFLSRPDFSFNRFHFFLETLQALREELRALGSDLIFLDEGPQQAYPILMQDLEREYGALPQTISWSKDYEPFARERDAGMEKVFSDLGISCLQHRDHLLIEPEELHKPDGGHYQVYSPFARKWLELFKTETIQKRVAEQRAGLKYLHELQNCPAKKIFTLDWKQLLQKSFAKYENNLSHYTQENGKHVTVEIPTSGSMCAYQALAEFQKKMDAYGEARDIPSLQATSQFSLFLKNGSLTIPQIIAYYQLQAYKKKQSGRDKFFSELIWREFYYHILFHNPRVEKESFLPQYKDLAWENNSNFFERWKEGTTGFPIVDAGMRELKNTGWMHNRVRMIVASFLTKDLLIDWRWGEKYFMETLLDGDLAPNNGGWQWAASTGCDPQPYFRIFNPWLQSQKFDSEGLYIKKHIPELNDVSAKDLHKPILDHKTYPQPMIEHSDRRELALQLYKQARETPS